MRTVLEGRGLYCSYCWRGVVRRLPTKCPSCGAALRERLGEGELARQLARLKRPRAPHATPTAAVRNEPACGACTTAPCEDAVRLEADANAAFTEFLNARSGVRAAWLHYESAAARLRLHAMPGDLATSRELST